MKFRKKPVIIDAVQWTGENGKEIHEFCPVARRANAIAHPSKTLLFIETLEGTMQAKPNDWIIKGVAGEFYSCKPDIFEKTYERIGD